MDSEKILSMKKSLFYDRKNPKFVDKPSLHESNLLNSKSIKTNNSNMQNSINDISRVYPDRVMP